MVDVVVVGAGIIGLTCAVRAQQMGARVAVVTADAPERTVSSVAAAVWYPTRIEGDPRVLGWGRRTFDELVRQAADGVPGVVMRPTRMLVRTDAVAPWWASAVPDFRIAEPPPAVASRTNTAPARPDLGGHAPVAEWRFTVPAVEMVPYLRWLVRRVTDAGGVLWRRRLNTLAEAAELAPLVVNATGLAAGKLAGDPAVYPVRGQVVMVANPGIVISVRDEQHPGGPTYVHPRRGDVVLGGTFEPMAVDPDPDTAVGRAILDRCTTLVPELAGAPVLGQAVGLRPARHGGVRVEVDPVPLTGGGARLIHNYGHGGAGVTLGWGCADEVAARI